MDGCIVCGDRRGISYGHACGHLKLCQPCLRVNQICLVCPAGPLVVYPCGACRQVFQSVTAVWQHVEQSSCRGYFDIFARRPVTCVHCKHVFSRVGELAAHAADVHHGISAKDLALSLCKSPAPNGNFHALAALQITGLM